tara:strand:+ start:906 stop:1133 length:228 start_codon:yes stop_codon:yes gene_type:complete
MAGKKGKTAAGRGVSKDSYKRINGEVCKPVLFAGKHAGYGTYMAGVVNGEMVVDSKGKPIPYKQIVGDKKTLVTA